MFKSSTKQEEIKLVRQKKTVENKLQVY